MNTITGRAFVQTGVAAAIASGATLAVSEPAHAGAQASERVDFTGDGVPLSAAEYAQLLRAARHICDRTRQVLTRWSGRCARAPVRDTARQRGGSVHAERHAGKSSCGAHARRRAKTRHRAGDLALVQRLRRLRAAAFALT